MKRIAIVVAALALIGYAALGLRTVVTQHQELKIIQPKLKSTTEDLKKIQVQYDQVNSNLDKELHQNKVDEEKVKKLESEKQEIQKQKEEAERQLQAKIKRKAEADALAQKAVNTITRTETAYAASPDSDKAFIYHHESGNNPRAVNSIGCRGIGQACPGTKLPCGDDYACQDAWFTNYAMTRYGSWAKARAFWEANRWW